VDIQRQLETVLNWGRYCELFAYDSEKERLYLPTDADAVTEEDNPEFPARSV